MKQQQRYSYKKPSASKRIGQVLNAFFSLTNARWLLSIAPYMLMHYVYGRNYSAKGHGEVSSLK